MMETMTVLLIEDSEDDAVVFREQLARASDAFGLEVDLIHVDRMSAAQPHLTEKTVDVVLLDLGLGDTHGIMTLERFQEISRDTTPVVVLTGLDDQAIATRAVQLGAQDYMVKGRIDGDVVLRALSYAIERHRLNQELAESRLREQEERERREELRRYFLAIHLEDSNEEESSRPDPICVENLAREYEDLIMARLQSRGDDDEHQQHLKTIVAGFAARKARSGDLIRLHVQIVEHILNNVSPAAGRVMSNHARVVLVEVLGAMLDHRLDTTPAIGERPHRTDDSSMAMTG